ncbi:uncharacterized protein LOC134935464 isoform X2 [Pseudophryne corroboree]
MSSKLITLASPKPRRIWASRNIRFAMPSIGTIWYLPMCWLFHIYLEVICIGEFNLTRNSHLISVVQSLLATSVVLMILFTASAVLEVGHSSVTDNAVCTYKKRASMNHILQAFRSQKYPLQALASFILINSYLLLQLSQLALDYLNRKSGNGTMHAEWNRVDANSSETDIEASLWPVPAEKLLTYLALCVHFAVPLIIYSVQESESVWQKEYLWGFFYSVILLLSILKYLSSSLTFYVISLGVHQSPHSRLFLGGSAWLPALYVISVLSLFLYSFSLKIYLELSFKTSVSDLPAANLTLRRKINLYPSPLWVILTTFVVVGSEMPFILHLISFLLLDRNDIFIVCLLAFSNGFCILCFCGCLLVGLRRRCRTNKSRIKKNRIDSGVCIANSFVYQASPETGKAMSRD